LLKLDAATFELLIKLQHWLCTLWASLLLSGTYIALLLCWGRES